MTKKSKIIILSLLTVLTLSAFYLIIVQKNAKPSPVVKTALEAQLFPNAVEDTLPQDTLKIPQDQWKTDSEALTLRALKYFEAKKLVTEPLAQDQVDYRKNLLKSWGRPWKLYFLKYNLTDEELKMVWDEELALLADTPEELAKLDSEIDEKLSRVKPKVEVDQDKFTGYYETYADIDKAYASGILGKVSLTNVKTPDNSYVVTKLVSAVNEIDKSLVVFNGIYEISSATRAIKLQALLRKLGYPAARASFHNLGKAIDFKLTKEAGKKFGALLSEKLPDGTTRLEKIDAMIKAGTYPTMALLISEKIVPGDYSLVQAYKVLMAKSEEVGVQIYDETPFFLTFSQKDNKLEWVSPVLHLQLKD